MRHPYHRVLLGATGPGAPGLPVRVPHSWRSNGWGTDVLCADIDIYETLRK